LGGRGETKIDCLLIFLGFAGGVGPHCRHKEGGKEKIFPIPQFFIFIEGDAWLHALLVAAARGADTLPPFLHFQNSPSNVPRFPTFLQTDLEILGGLFCKL
jgi:hypothetical protein